MPRSSRSHLAGPRNRHGLRCGLVVAEPLPVRRGSLVVLTSRSSLAVRLGRRARPCDVLLWPRHALAHAAAAAAPLATPWPRYPCGGGRVRRARRLRLRRGGLQRPGRHRRRDRQPGADRHLRALLGRLRGPCPVLGDVFRAFNPWRAIARGAAWVARDAWSAIRCPSRLCLPRPAGSVARHAGILAFAWLELVYSNRDDPATLAILALSYAAVQPLGMSVFGIETWTERADAFAALFRLYSRLDRDYDLRRLLQRPRGEFPCPRQDAFKGLNSLHGAKTTEGIVARGCAGYRRAPGPIRTRQLAPGPGMAFATLRPLASRRATAGHAQR